MLPVSSRSSSSYVGAVGRTVLVEEVRGSTVRNVAGLWYHCVLTMLASSVAALEVVPYQNNEEEQQIGQGRD